MCCVSKLYVNGWSCIVNTEDKEYLLLSMKRLNELASVIRKALENEGILVSQLPGKKVSLEFPRVCISS